MFPVANSSSRRSSFSDARNWNIRFYRTRCPRNGEELGQNPTDKEFFEVVSTVDREMKGLIGKTRKIPTGK